MKTCGYVALLGLPNAGKSTLLNACIGQKIAGVSRKPQTTRNQILGILTKGEAQLLFIDTPGLQKKNPNLSLLGRMMNQQAWTSLNQADCCGYLVDVTKGFSEEDLVFFSQVGQQIHCPVFLLLSKVDKVKNAEVTLRLQEATEILQQHGLEDRIPIYLISAKRKESLDPFLEKVRTLLPEGPWLFPEDDLTDRPTSFVLQEYIREQVFRNLGQELPYTTSVRVEKVEDTERLVRVFATIYANRDSHQRMIVGEGGSMIKKIGSESRLQLETFLGKKVFLDLRVKTKLNWVDSTAHIEELLELTL